MLYNMPIVHYNILSFTYECYVISWPELFLPQAGLGSKAANFHAKVSKDMNSAGGSMFFLHRLAFEELKLTCHNEDTVFFISLNLLEPLCNPCIIPLSSLYPRYPC